MYPIKYFLNTDYQEMEVLGVTGLFTNLRVERESLPEGFYKYSLRDGDEDFLSSIERSVLVNHMGDFICKGELDLGEEGIKDLNGEYAFTDESVDLDKFFGVDIKLKTAEALDRFMADFDPYHYGDVLEIDQENMVDEIRTMLDDREQTEGILAELKEIYEERKGYMEEETVAFLSALISKVADVLSEFPERRAELSAQIDAAESQKGKALGDDEQLEPVVSEP